MALNDGLEGDGPLQPWEVEDTMAKTPTYKIIRFFQDDRPSEVQLTGLTLEQAQHHCTLMHTHGDGWFDGYDEEK